MITHIVFFKLSEPTPEKIAGTREKLLSMSWHAGEVLPHMKSVCSSIVAVDYES